MRRLLVKFVVIGCILMAGRSATFYLGGQSNAQAAVETGLVFNPSSLSVDNNGPQTIAIDNPPIVIPPYTVGRIIPITLQSNRIKAVATGLSTSGSPAALTWYEDSQTPASGNSIQTPFTAPTLGFVEWNAVGTAQVLNVNSLNTLPAGLYRVLSVVMGMLQPSQNAVGITCAPINIPLAINAVYSPFASYTLPAPTLISSNGSPTQLQFIKSDATTNVNVLVMMYVLPYS